MKLGNKKLVNPFIYQGYESPAYFCDREAETSTLLSHLKSAKAALKVLEEKELVYRTDKGYVIYDRFMDLWLKRL